MVQILSNKGGSIGPPARKRAEEIELLLCRKDLKDPPTAVGGIRMQDLKDE